MAGDTNGKSRYQVPNLDRALTIIELLSGHAEGLTIPAICERLEVPKNSVFRITTTLHQRGYLDREDSTRLFRLSPKFLALGTGAALDRSLVENAMDVMRELRDRTKETVLLGTLIESEGVVLEQVPSTHNFKFMVDAGTRFELHTAAPGKAILARLPELERDRILDRFKWTKYNEQTITSRRRFMEELKGVRACGFGVDHAEEIEGQHCVAAAILDHRDYPVAGIWITAPSVRLPASAFEEVGQLVVESAKQISRRMGHHAIGVA